VWFRNTWSWTKEGEAGAKPKLTLADDGKTVHAAHESLGNFVWELDGAPEVLFTENESDTQALWGLEDSGLHHKDAFHKYLVQGVREAVNPEQEGTKCCAVYSLTLGPGEQRELLFRLAPDDVPPLPREQWRDVFHLRIREANEFYAPYAESLGEDAANVQRQAFGGLFWSKQFYHLVVETWLNGDPDVLPPPEQRKFGRNHSWRELFNEDIISMPDKWEYPWYAAWDLAFHTVAIAVADPDFSKGQLSLFLREWYMHPNGQLPAYEWAFSDVNPPVHAWACWRVFEIDKRVKGKPDYPFLERVFHKLLMNFTWWVNRKDSEGANIFEGGFLGLDNIGVFNRSEDLPPGWLLEQSDGSSWMAMYCLNMLKIALTLSAINPVYEDIASKFFEHFLYIADAINHHLDTGLWDEEDGFYYDRLRTPGHEYIRMRVRSLVGIVPLFATDTLEEYLLDRHRGFLKRMRWFITNRGDLTEGLASLTEGGVEHRRLLSVVNRQRLERILQRVFDEEEFLSPYGVRSVSRYHKDHPYELQLNGHSASIAYEPAESRSGLFGGNSNWRGPVWMPMNFLLIEALDRLDHYYGESMKVEFPTRSGQWVTLRQAGRLLSKRLSGLFLRGPDGKRPIYGENAMFQHDSDFKDLLQFHEYFHGDSGKGLGASHQTGWTGLIAKLL
ncbi:MAG TPA: glucosidase, partial [Bryobacteraceae bacterium]